MILKKVFHTINILSLVIFSANANHSSYWDWRTIDICNTSFPENFIWATVQYSQEIASANYNTTESAWKKNYTATQTPENLLLKGANIANQLSLSGHAIAINWAAVEPYQEVYDEQQIGAYKELCEELNANNIRPIIILKDHLCDPLWFGYIGGFEKQENSIIFQRYCLRMVKELAHTNPIIITFQSPEMYAINGYYLQKLAPGKKNAQLVFDVLYHQLEAHTNIYHAIKKLPLKKPLMVGITKHIQPIKPWRIINPIDHITCKLIHELREKPFIDWFTKGSMQVHIPFIAKKTLNNNLAKGSLDFIGIDTHSHIYTNNFKLITNPLDIKTGKKDVTLHPESLYSAISYTHKHISKPLNIPIYITQSGIITRDETIRDLFFKRYLYVLSKSIENGYDVRGYYYWSLFDGYAGSNKEISSGIIQYNPAQKTLSIKDGAQYFVKIISDKAKLFKK